MLKEAVKSEDYEDISNNVESLFTNLLAKETIEYILHKIYVEPVKPFCKKSIFKKLFVNLTKECFFPFNKFRLISSGLIKQIDRCPVGGPLSVAFSEFFMCKME